MRQLAIALILVLLLNPAIARERGTPRDMKDITTIVIHSVAGPYCLARKVLFTSAPKRVDDAAYWRDRMRRAPVADAHFVIGRAGQVVDVIPIDQIANHTVGVNPVSIGIELVNDGDGREALSTIQIDSLIALIRQLRIQAPGIRLENIVTHADIDRRTCPCGGGTFHRRQDPGTVFPMDKIRQDVALPGDDPGATSKLPRLTGAAPASAC